MKTQTKPRKAIHRLRASLRAGFSLVELLIVIAVIGIIAAIAIPSISGINSAATKSKAQRNAQNVASVFASAMAAGAPSTGITDTDTAVAAVTGTNALTGTGAFAGKTFSVPGLAGNDLLDAKEFLNYSGGNLQYNPNATFTAN